MKSKRKTVYNTNFDRMIKLGIITESDDEHRVSKSSDYMDLVVEIVHYEDWFPNQEKATLFSLTHYFEQNGDLCKDPDMIVAVCHDSNEVRALTFEMSIPPLYQVVYPDEGKVYPSLERELNSFLRTWLNNLIAQGHGFTTSIGDSNAA